MHQFMDGIETMAVETGYILKTDRNKQRKLSCRKFPTLQGSKNFADYSVRPGTRVLVWVISLLLLVSVTGCSEAVTVKADPSRVQAHTDTSSSELPKTDAVVDSAKDTAGEAAGEEAASGKKVGTESAKDTAGEAAGEEAASGKTVGTESAKDTAGETVGKEAASGKTEKESAVAGAASETDAGEEVVKDDAVEITFTAVGDNLINEVLYGQAAERAAEEGEGEDYDFSPCYAQVAPFIREHDVNWIDIETLMTDTCAPAGFPFFSTPGDSGRALIDAGWNVFSLCSNHTYDLGAYGIGESLAFWRKMKEETSSEGGICCTGLWEYGTEYAIPILTCKGKKIAFLTYTYGTNEIPTPEGAAGHVIYLDEEGMMAYQIELAHEQADAVIVSLHWGTEYNHYETQEQRDLAQRVADMGADLIIGGHPHVVEGAEMLTASDGRKVFCAYSLGNFLCAQNSMPNPDAMIGLILSCTFRFTEDGLSVEDHALIPILSDYGEYYADDHVVLYSDYTQESALTHGMRTMFGFTQFDYDYVREMLTDVVGPEYLKLP